MGKRHSPEQVVRKLREAERLLAEGTDLAAVCRQLEISVQTYQRWRSQFKAMRPEDVVRLKALGKENARLKRLLAERSSITTCCGRWLGETSEPGAAAQGGHAPAKSLRGRGTSGLPRRRSASLLAALPPPSGTGGVVSTGAVASARASSPALRLPAHSRAFGPRGLGL